MGWELAGFACERGSTAWRPRPAPAVRAQARAAAERVARRFEVKFATREQVQGLAARTPGATLYLLDVRIARGIRGERIAGSRPRAGRAAGPGDRRIRRRAQCARRAHRPGTRALGDDRVLAEPDGLGRSLCAGARGRGRIRRLAARARRARAEIPSISRTGRTSRRAADLARRARGRRHRDRPVDQSPVSRASHSGRLVGGARAARPGARTSGASARLGADLRGRRARASRGAARPRRCGRARECACSRAATRHGSRRACRSRTASTNATTTLDDVWYKPYDHAQRLRKARARLPRLGSRPGRADQARSDDPVSRLLRRPATARTLPGAASQIAKADSRLKPIAVQKAGA